jgi:UDP-glucose 4-epimerase
MDKNWSNSFNLGNGNGHSVREVIEAVRKAGKREFRVVEAGRREGDPPALISSSRKAVEMLDWKPQFADLEMIIETAWKWHQKALSL